MPDCPLADECPSFSERIEGMGCQYYGDRGGKEWCNHYGQPIEDLKTAPVVPGEELVVDVSDLHESGAGIGHTEDGFVVMVDGVLPEARARIEVETVKPNYARGELLEKLPLDADPEAAADGDAAASGDAANDAVSGDATDDDAADDEGDESEDDAPRLGSRDNFWGA